MFLYCIHTPYVVSHCQMVGDKTAPLKRLVAGSVEWAKLEPAGEATVADFIDSISQDETSLSGKFQFYIFAMYNYMQYL